uniref:Uncharacterized protein n=1 Tax=Fagus sylvatica TaxID=28930 RepID=A0A2N9GPD6_FAGSY
MESIEDMWKNFSLSDKEGLNVDLANTSQQSENILAAKFLTSRVLNMDAVARTFKPLWKTRQSFTVQDLGGNKVAFVFEDAMDLERVLMNEPWTYDKFLVVFQRVQGDEPIQDSMFSHTSFWVQIHNLPIRRRTEEAAESIGRSIGLVEKVAAIEDERGGENCMRVRIRLEVNSPLCRGQKDCDVGIQQRQASTKQEYQFGAWLRATSDRAPHKTAVIVPGNQPKSRNKPDRKDPAQYQPTAEAEDLTSDLRENGKSTENTEADPEHEMEIEHNPGFPFQTRIKKSNIETFNNQLKEIDQAINYMPFGENIPDKNPELSYTANFQIEHGLKSAGPIAHPANNLSSPSRRPLQNISNGPCKNQEPKTHTTKWKKLARAQKPTSGPPIIVQPLKRDFMLIEEDPVQGKRPKAGLDQSLPEAMKCISWNCRGLGNQATIQELANLVRLKDPSVLFLSETWMDEDRLELDSDQPWRLTCFYGAPETHLREHSWNLLRTLNGQLSLPWCCFGDFNEIVRSSEKSGHRNQSESQMQRFRAVIDECGFLDLGFRGLPFTWCNNRRGRATTWLRLDRFMATNEWIQRFSSAAVDHIECSTSDHKPIYMNTHPMQVPRPRQKLFRFEDMWRMHPDCEPVVTQAWVPKTRGSPLAQVRTKIQRCGEELSRWSRAQFGNITKILKEKTELLRQAEVDSTLGYGHDTVISIRQEVNVLLLKEEKMWQQRSRVSWLKEGDRNTKYFHNRASQRRRRNSIQTLIREDGEIVTGSEAIGTQFTDYYQALFTANPLEDVEVVLDGIQPCVTQAMNQNLISQFTEEEVITAMKQMAPLKAPGPDGMPPIFYQSYWHVVGKDISSAVLYCLHSGKVGNMALKLDMSKAYDRVEWGFLKQVMVRMGFHDRWISLIMECISTVTYSILINGNPTGHITPTRGLRQGDPISPYLFLLCAEGLNGLIRKASLQGEIHGVSLCPRGPKITNLFFADDSLLFCRASLPECQKIQEILTIYEKASGQQLNRAKTTLFFSKNTPQAMQEDLKEILGVPSIQQYEKYLGLPSLIGKEKITCFSQIKERVWSKVKGWKEKLLSQAGREILIKAVVQAIPTYTMNCFKLPVTLCKEIEGIIRRFWWGHNGENRKIHWLKWEKLCRPKGTGGLGFRDLQKFNPALLAKQFWRLMHNTNSLLYKVFSAKFFPHGNIMEASEKNRGSFAWRSILKAKELIQSGMSWRVGDGIRIPIKGSNWLLDEGHRRVLSPLPDLPKDARVVELIHGSPPKWNINKVQSLFLPYDAEAILKIPLSERVQEDKIFWFDTRDGKYSVRSGYKLLLKDARVFQAESSRHWDPDPLWKRIWGASVPTKVKSFLWRACHDSLPTNSGLFQRKVLPNPLCGLCQSQREDSLHALWACSQLSQVWNGAPEFSVFQNRDPRSFSDLVRHVMQTDSDNLLEKLAVTCWLIWNKRNHDRHHPPSEQYSQLWTRAQSVLHEYLAVNTEEKAQKPKPPQARWRLPVNHYYKMNFDGAIFKDSNSGGIGVVIRDNTGQVIATLSQKVFGTHTVEMIEALAARRAIIFAREVGIDNVEVEGDAENIIKDLSSNDPLHTPYGLVIEDAKALIQDLQQFSLSHTRRSGNSVAHALARRASGCNSFSVWLEEVPPDITHVLMSDLLALK